MIIAAWWAAIIIPGMIADAKADVVRIGKLPDGYKLSKTETADDGITHFYKNKNSGYITLRYLPETDMSLKQYLESQKVYAKYTTLVPTNQGMMCMYIYSKENESVGVVDPSTGLFIVNANIDRYELKPMFQTGSSFQTGRIGGNYPDTYLLADASL